MKTVQISSCNCQTITEESDLLKNEGCSASSDEQYACNKFHDPGWIKENIEYFPAGFAAPKGIFKNISPEEAYQMLQQNINRSDYTILDVKTEQEYCQQHISGSQNIDFFSSTFKDELFSLDKERRYIVICKIGVRSEIAMNVMKKMGFTEVYNVSGGDDKWIAEGIPYSYESVCCQSVSDSSSV